MSARRSFLSISAPLVLAIAVFTAYSSHSSNMRLQALKAKNANAFFPGQTVLLVGATSGIGEAMARRLAQAKFNVVVAGRSVERGNAVVAALAAAHPDGAHRFVPLDAQYVRNIRGLSHEVPQIDKLVFTQGIATIQGRTPTSEGIDQKMALHYYGRMALIQEFLPLLRESRQSPRVLSVFSAGVHKSYDGLRDDPEMTSSYTLQNAANAAGFYNDLMLDAWSVDPANAAIAFGHAAPGIVATNWGTEMPWVIRALLKPLKAVFAKSANESAEFMCDFLLDPAVAPGQLHLIDQYGQPAARTELHTDAARDFIRQHTEALLDRVATP
ncbi:Aste57867_22821 [Aphanomyces stellatus]|uniref:Aste57867_22821 protein n=1 Tax=Aphanomyces stellatus TaxID=120398 RepID=A0A485LMN8_9STRA|nr:hypothetical protein As57867_022751 [Aphanomyces stellatus]VFT99472.1 Aste57867_22821 [Aphanomyces stellatus]